MTSEYVPVDPEANRTTASGGLREAYGALLCGRGGGGGRRSCRPHQGLILRRASYTCVVGVCKAWLLLPETMVGGLSSCARRRGGIIHIEIGRWQ